MLRRFRHPGPGCRFAVLLLVSGLALPLARHGAPAHAAMPAGDDPLEANKAIALRFNAAISAHDLSLLDAFVAPDVIDHNADPAQAPGLDGLKDGLAAFITGFPDVQLDVQQVIAEGDTVADRVVSHGTNTGSLFGMPPTGRAVSVEAYDIYRIADGRIVEIWHQEDMFGELVQLGVIPPPGGPPN